MVLSPSVSVVLPICNAWDYLQFAVDSILHQILFNFELILSDDHSTDKSLAVARRY